MRERYQQVIQAVLPAKLCDLTLVIEEDHIGMGFHYVGSPRRWLQENVRSSRRVLRPLEAFPFSALLKHASGCRALRLKQTQLHAHTRREHFHHGPMEPPSPSPPVVGKGKWQSPKSPNAFLAHVDVEWI